MAKATHNPAVTRTEVVTVKEETVTLELSTSEAERLRDLLGKCSTISSPNYWDENGLFQQLNNVCEGRGWSHNGRWEYDGVLVYRRNYPIKRD